MIQLFTYCRTAPIFPLIFVAMSVLKKIFHFYIESSIHVALAICALAGISTLNYNINWDWRVFLFLFTAAITGYNFTKYAKIAGLHHRSLTNQLKSIQVFSLLCFIALIYATFLQSLKFIGVTAALGLLTFFYAIPFAPNHKNLREIKSLKIFIIAIVWAGATLWLPLIEQQKILTLEVGINTLSYSFLILALMMPFEIRDLKYDAIELDTVPQLLGVSKTKIIGYILCLLFVGSLLFLSHHPFFLTSGIGIAILLMVFIHYSHKNQSDFYASFWVEAIPIIWFLGLWIAHY